MDVNATLLVQFLAFILLIYFVKAKLWGPISRVMEDRQKDIEEGLLAAKKSQSQQKDAEQKAEVLIEKSKNKASEIVELANKQSLSIIEKAKTQAQKEVNKIKENMEQDLVKSVESTKKELRQEVSSLVMEGVRKIVEKEVDKNKHKEILEKLSQSL